ncbi:MAG TPA: LysR substrate-binding domain-containing protein [Alphaproteobacteria bacterium]|nr:LysR substrate-binding domain-containing protein [Alphaproteobacteria bacterium]
MRLRHIEVLHATMLTGTVSAAAKLLNVSQPAVTKVLHHAEDQLGIKFFQRIKGRLYPTPEGLALYHEARKIYSELEDMKRLARNLRDGRSGHLRIAASPALTIDMIPLAIGRFLQHHPDVTLEVETHHYKDLVNAVLVQEVDLGFAFDAAPHPGLEIEALAEGDFVGILPVALAADRRGPLPLDAFNAQRFIGLRSEDPLGATLRARAQMAGVALSPQIEVKTNRIALCLVGNGAGAAIVDQYTAAAGSPDAVSVFALEDPIRFRIHAIRAQHRPPSVIAQHFTREFVAVEAETAAAVRQRLR